MTPTEQQLCDAFGKDEPCDGIREMARCFDAAGTPVPDDADGRLDSDQVRRLCWIGFGTGGVSPSRDVLARMFGTSGETVRRWEERAFSSMAAHGGLWSELGD